MNDAKENTRKVSALPVPASLVVKDNEKIVLGNVMEKPLPRKQECKPFFFLNISMSVAGALAFDSLLQAGSSLGFFCMI